MGDVADRAGVSRQAVGIVFRGEVGVGSETRDRILRAAADLGYQPDVAAQTLRQRASNYLGVVFSPGHSAEVDIVDALYPVAADHGYEVVLSAVTSTRDAPTAVREVLGYRCAALLIIGGLAPSELHSVSQRLPLVMIGGEGIQDNACDYVRSAGDVGVGLLVDHLWSLGHRDIAYVYGAGMTSAGIRHRGYLQAMRRLGLPTRTVRVRSSYTEECGAEAAAILLGEDRFPTAVMASNDHAAVGFIHSCLKHGLRVPEDVSVTGFDDSTVARLSYVQLTTARQDGRQMAEASVAAALSRIKGRREVIESVITPTLIVRSTTRPPRRRTRVIKAPRTA